MKKRIISFLLALVLVFSCLSLNAFATDAVLAETEKIDFQAEDVEPQDAAKYQEYGIGLEGKSNLSKDDFATLANANGATVKINTDFTELPSELVIKTGSTATDIISPVTEGANTYYKWRADSNTPAGEYIRYQPETENRTTMLNDLKNGTSNVLGASYVITFDFMYYGNWANSNSPNESTSWLFDLRGLSGANAGSNVPSSINFRILENGNILRLQNAGNNYDTQISFTPGAWVQLSFWHTPRGIDGIEGTADDNTYHVYANGEYVASCTAITTPADYTYTSGGKTYNYNCATDFVLSYTDFLRNNTKFNMTSDLYAADNFRFYYGDFLECKHDWSYSHTHDIESGKSELSAECAWCGKTESVAQSMVKSGKLTAEDLGKISDIDVAINTEFVPDTQDGVYVGASSLEIKNNTNYEAMTYEDGYLKWKGVEYTSAPNGDYLQYEPITSKGAGEKYVKDNYEDKDALGKSYAITFDILYYGEMQNSVSPWLLNAPLSYTGDGFDKVTSSMNFRLKKDGTIRLNDLGANKDTSVSLKDAGWVQLTFWHTPKGIDGIEGTENKYHVFANGKYITSCSAVSDTSDYSKEAYTWNAATDFTLAKIQMFMLTSTFTSTTAVDLFAIDNLRIYYGNFAECAHADINGDSCVENGKCTSCGKTVTAHCDFCGREVKYSGVALDKDVAVTNRNVSLGEEINMNVYLELSEAAKADAGTLVRITGADGKRVAEIPLAKLELMTAGEAVGRYKATLPLRSIDMAREVKVEIIKDGAAYGTAYTTSVEDYLKALIKTDENAAELAAATLNYGAYAQKYFAAKNPDNAALDDVLPNGGITDNVATAEPIFGTDADISVSDGNTINFTYASLVLSNTTKINLYFKVSANAVVTMGEKTIAKQYNAETGEYFVTLAGAGPKAFDEPYEITVTDGSYSGTVTLSVNSVLKLVLESTETADNEAYQNLARALYLYSTAAENYRV